MTQEEKINIAEILKDCPKGTKLYSPLCGECYFDRLNMGTVICIKQNTQEITFTSGGYYMLPMFDDCECQLFPSKDQRDWSKFQRPFMDGDVVFSGYDLVSIYKEQIGGRFGRLHSYVSLRNNSILEIDKDNWTLEGIRFATQEEKAKLFQAIKDNGYRWNADTKNLERLTKFKIGDRIRLKGSTINLISTVTKINEDGSIAVNDCSFAIKYELQDDWELVPDKFAITTLKPFESRVLVRDHKLQKWHPAMWGFYDFDSQDYKFILVGDIARCCIPYEGNEHLLGTTNDCDEYYKNW